MGVMFGSVTELKEIADDLLVALKAALEIYEHFDDGLEALSWINDARAAIAKAEGK